MIRWRARCMNQAATFPLISASPTISVSSLRLRARSQCRLADAPFTMECKTWKTIEVNGDRVLMMGEGINFYIRDELWDPEKMRVHVDRYHPIGRMFADRYCRTDDRVIFPARACGARSSGIVGWPKARQRRAHPLQPAE